MFDHLWDDLPMKEYFERPFRASDARCAQRGRRHMVLMLKCGRHDGEKTLRFPGWMSMVEQKLQLWRKLKYREHRLLASFDESLEELVVRRDNSTPSLCLPSSEGNSVLFLVVARRRRRRRAHGQQGARKLRLLCMSIHASRNEE